MTPVHMPPLESRIDQIARRQSARFLDRLRQAGQSTPTIERDFMRAVKFLLGDVKALIHETSTEASGDHHIQG